MQIHNVQQGTQAWHDLRASHFTASEAPAMMGASRFKSRDQLLKEKATGITEAVTPQQQAKFDQGHAAEAAARPLAEAIVGEELFPVTGSETIEGLPLLASFDGLTMMEDTAYEHKLWNQKVVAQIQAEALTPEYYWQLEQQLLVSGAERTLFDCSDGTEDNKVWCWYHSDDERRKQLIAGWKQFKKDLDAYQPEPDIVEAKAQPLMALPSLHIQLTGQVNSTNLVEYKADILGYINAINENLDTDQDFADAQATVKQLDKAEKELKAVEKQALSQTADIEELFRSIEHIGKAMREKRLALNKLVKSRKETIKLQMVTDAKLKLLDHIEAINERLGFPIPTVTADFAAAIKGKQNLKPMQEAINTTLAQAKIEADLHQQTLTDNLTLYRDTAKDFDFLFPDLADLIQLDGEHLKLLINTRIKEHQAAETKRLEAEREKIRQEEQAKAEAKRYPDPEPASAAERYKKEQKKVLLNATTDARERIKNPGYPIDDFDDTAYQMTVLKEDFHHLSHYYDQPTLEQLLWDEQGNEYELMLTIKRVRMK